MLYDFADPVEERLRYSQYEAQRAQVERARQQTSADVVVRLGQLASMYPHVEAGVLIQLARRGASPGDPVVEELSKLAARREADVDSGGGLFSDIGGFVSSGVKAGSDVVKDAVGEAVNSVKPLVRTAFVALETPIEEIVGFTGDVLAAQNPIRAHSTGFLALGDFIGDVAGGDLTPDVDLGSGFFSGGDIRERQAKIMREIGRAHGLKNQGFTIGRYFANEVFEPGTIPYNTLSGVTDALTNVFADPVNYLGVGLIDEPLKARKVLLPAQRVATDAIDIGAVPGLRRTVLPEKVHEWMFSDKARRVWQWMAQETNLERLWASTGRGKIDPVTLNRVRRAESEADVMEIMAPMLGVQLRGKPTVPLIAHPGVRGRVARGVSGGFETLLSRPVYDVRIFGGAPQGIFDLRDDSQMVENLDRVLRNAKVDSTTRGARLSEYVDAAQAGPEAKYQLIKKVYSEDVRGKLVESGVDEDTAKRMTTLFFDSHDDMRAYWLRDLADGSKHTAVVADALKIDQHDPHLIVEALSNTVELPDFREVRRGISPRIVKFLTAKATKEGVKQNAPLSFLMAAQDKVWKRTALLRAAYPIRVIGEEQFRMAATGYDSLFRHPISWLSFVTGRKGADDALGETFDATRAFEETTAFQQAMVRQWAGWVDEPAGFVASKGTARYGPQTPEFADALANELAKYAADPVMSRVARGGLGEGDLVPANLSRDGLDGIKNWFSDGTGQKFRDWLAENPKRAGLKVHRSEADAYLDTFAERLSHFSLEDPVIREAIATGKWGDEAPGLAGKTVRAADRENLGRVLEVHDDGTATVRFVNREKRTRATVRLPVDELTALPGKGNALVRMTQRGPQVHPGFKRYLRDKVRRGEVPENFWVKGDKYLRNAPDNVVAKAWDNATDWAFSALMGVPTNKLSRSPVFKQAYRRRFEELAPVMDDGSLTLSEVDDLAKGFALDETKALLYDLSERSQFFDITRLLFPFGEAWKEVITRWAKIIAENPTRVPRRFQQGIEGARGSGVGDTLSGVPLIGDSFQPGQGFFYENANGEEVFAYPFSAAINKQLFGVPIPLEGRVQGLSLMTEVLPGLGPVAQIGAAYFLPHTPEWKDVREVLFPFGEPEGANEFFPGWVQKIKAGGVAAFVPGVAGAEIPDPVGAVFGKTPDEVREFANTVMHIAAWKVTSGDRPRPTGEHEMRELIEDSTEAAKRFYAVRGWAQFGAPSAPAPEWQVKDKHGRTLIVNEMRREFFDLADEVGYQAATDRFLAKHGDLATYFTTTGFTDSLVYGSPVTSEGAEWAADNPDLRKALPNVYGLFAPVGGDFDFDAYMTQFAAGEREPRTPREYLHGVNNAIARNVLSRAKKAAGPDPTPQTRQLMASLRALLQNEYPGFDPSPFGGIAGKAGKVSPEVAIAELRKAVELDKIRDTPQGQALGLYLRARDAAEAKARAMGLTTFRNAKSARPLRDILRALATVLSARYQGFGVIYDELLDREMTDDFDQEVIAA